MKFILTTGSTKSISGWGKGFIRNWIGKKTQAGKIPCLRRSNGVDCRAVVHNHIFSVFPALRRTMSVEWFSAPLFLPQEQENPNKRNGKNQITHIYFIDCLIVGLEPGWLISFTLPVRKRFHRSMDTSRTNFFSAVFSPPRKTQDRVLPAEQEPRRASCFSSIRHNFSWVINSCQSYGSFLFLDAALCYVQNSEE